MYVTSLVIFALVVGILGYLDARRGLDNAFPLLLRIAFPLLMSGVVVKLIGLIGISDDIRYLIAGIGFLIFFAIFFKIFPAKERTRKKLPIYQILFGGMLGIVRGWLYFGIVAIYVERLFSPGIESVLLKPASMLLFLSFSF